MLELINVSKSFGENIAVENLSFSVNKGEVVGFLGPNGAGKSTVMRMINSIIKPDLGQIKHDGINISEVEDTIKRSIGYLPENNPLPGDLYVKEYLDFICDVYKVDTSKIGEVIKLTGLSTMAEKKVSQLSKGYKQRLGIAAAFIFKPKYLILDEPTTGLDPNQIDEIRDLIKEYGKENTVILSTHIMQEVEAICDRVILINKGKMVADKKLSEFTQSNTNTFKVEFSQEVSLDQIEKLNLNNIEVLNSKTFKISDDREDLIDIIGTLAKENSNSILSFSVYKNSLEEAFKELVK